ncbi:MAG: RNA polymerase sigma factor [Verrucomicrobia bacterium]|nr:RNA polymerase sigma factor [Verrucomicrobiota bacterium]MBU4247700.1 RNA polymerase sigma factor [Verrucomicrobiota bacterium]MBU4290358.1 RNA polymerase sigma factor [Verrucomicrobiota bacterium]MBU4496690.1 RNA polymerase sigma factor [Verrucomicrobiota bacterium]MCG2679860.1 RNA polymerase sigma factor [Kiritimatiellia bacterium]
MDNIAQTAPSVKSDGNREFEVIITAHQSALLRYVTRIVNDANAAQDVVQETFIKLFRVWRDGARPTDNLRPWLYRVAHNTAIDYIRRESRLHHLHEQEASERAAPDPANPGDPSERVQLILGHLRRLDPAEQQVLLLRMQEGLSYREISLVTGRTEGNIGCILHHAVKKVSASLKKAGLISKGAN